MNAMESIVQDLKSLPPDKIDDAAWLVHSLVENSARDRGKILKRTATTLSSHDVDEMEKAISETCEETDKHVW